MHEMTVGQPSGMAMVRTPAATESRPRGRREPMTGRRAWGIGIQFALSAAILGVFLWRVDAAKLVRELRTADWRWIVLGMVVVAGAKVARGVRWWLLLRRTGPVPLRGAVLVLLVAIGVGAVLPLRAGTALQLQVLHRRYGVDRTAVAGTLVAEGMLDAPVLLLLALATAPLLPVTIKVSVGLLLVVGGVMLALAGLVVLGSRGRGWRWTALPPRLRAPVGRWLADLSRGFAVFDSTRSILLLLLLTLSDWAIAAVVFYGLVGKAVGLTLPWSAFLAVELSVNLADAVPLTASNIGPYEFAVRETLIAIGADGDRAAAFAVAAHAALILGTALTGLAAVWALHLRREDLFYLRRDRAATPRGSVEAPPSQQS